MFDVCVFITDLSAFLSPALLMYGLCRFPNFEYLEIGYRFLALALEFTFEPVISRPFCTRFCLTLSLLCFIGLLLDAVEIMVSPEA